MKRALFIVAAAFALSACATRAPVELTPAPASPPRVVAIATLSTNACEASTAADYTAVITSRLTAARLLRTGQISRSAAVAVQDKADGARELLDRSCIDGKPDQAAIDKARALRADIAKLLEVRP
jgi:hypothetical protein